jgi:hypothetical protein
MGAESARETSSRRESELKGLMWPNICIPCDASRAVSEWGCSIRVEMPSQLGLTGRVLQGIARYSQVT